MNHPEPTLPRIVTDLEAASESQIRQLAGVGGERISPQLTGRLGHAQPLARAECSSSRLLGLSSGGPGNDRDHDCRATSRLELEFYPIGKLVQGLADGRDPRTDHHEVAQGSWSEAGGGGFCCRRTVAVLDSASVATGQRF